MNTRLRRLILQIATFLSMAVVIYLNEDVYVILITLSIFGVLPLVWVAAALLVWASRQAPEIESLSDAADNMLTVAINTSIAAMVAALVLARVAGVISESVGTFLTLGLGYIIVANVFPATRALHTFRDVWMPRIRLR